MSSTICNSKILTDSRRNLMRNRSDKMQKDSPDVKKLGQGKRELTLKHIFMLNAVVCGIEVCACAGFTFIPPMLLKSGYSEENMSIILGIGPLLGFFFVPLIGRASDRCRSPYGRRRPFILVLSSFLTVSLVIVPYGEWMCRIYPPGSGVNNTIGMLMLLLGVVLLDFTSQSILTPCEALLSDSSKGTDQHGRVFSVYSIMISFGGFFGYLVTAVDWQSALHIGSQEQLVFTFLIVLFIILTFCSLLVAQDLPFSQIHSQSNKSSLKEPALLSPLKDESIQDSHILESGYETSGSSEDEAEWAFWASRSTVKRKSRRRGIHHTIRRHSIVYKSKRLFHFLCFNISDKLPEPVRNLIDIPLVLWYLVFANFFSWTAVMAFNLFYTDYVGQAIYGGNPNAQEGSELRTLYDEGVRMGSWGLLLHCITSAFYAFVVERLIEKIGCRNTYMLGMFIFTLSMFGMVLTTNVTVVTCMAAFTGFAYATLTIAPFILVSKYHAESQVYYFDLKSNSGPHERGIATDMAAVDSAYFLSQVVLSAIMGSIVHLTGTVISYMVTAGVMGLLSCICIRNIVQKKEDLAKLKPKTSRSRKIMNDI